MFYSTKGSAFLEYFICGNFFLWMGNLECFSVLFLLTL